MTGRLGIGIITYNRKDVLAETLARVKAHTTSPFELVVADASEAPPGEPLFVKLVDRGRIVYRESFEEQADRADRTWGKYRRWVLSDRVHAYQEKFRAMRAGADLASKQLWG